MAYDGPPPQIPGMRILSGTGDGLMLSHVFDKASRLELRVETLEKQVAILEGILSRESKGENHAERSNVG